VSLASNSKRGATTSTGSVASAPASRAKGGLYERRRTDGGQLKVPKAAEIVSNELRRQIIRGEIASGAALAPENALMERFGVSRPTLREAVRILESEGLITIIRGARGGSVVHRPSVDIATRYLGLILQVNGTSLAEIYQVHALIEPAAARVVAEKQGAKAGPVLRDCLAAGREHLDNDFLYGTDTARFRNKLIELAGIPTLSLLTAVLDDIFERSWATLTVAAGQQVDNQRAKRRGIRSSEKLIEFIEAGDGRGAEEHWRKHTAMVGASMRQWLEATHVIDILENY
jgi:DNA-binding FadR family transcriptional regulator